MPPKPPRQTIILTEFDERTIGRSTQLLKALIPFLEPSQQRMFGLMVRVIEFNMTLDFFNHNRIPACAFKPCCGSDMLSELKSYCSPEEQKQLDMMIGMIKAQKLQAAAVLLRRPEISLRTSRSRVMTNHVTASHAVVNRRISPSRTAENPVNVHLRNHLARRLRHHQ